MQLRTLGLLVPLLLAGCAQPPTGTDPSPLDPPVIGGNDDLRRGPPPPASPDAVRIPKGVVGGDAQTSIVRLRGTALQEAAQSWGSQMGYARRAWEISGTLEKRSGQLSEVFDFNRVVAAAPARTGVVVPPVVSRSFDAFRADGDGREVSAADEYLTIMKPGRLAPTAPTWRDYLVFLSADPVAPPKVLRPETDEESRLFEGWFREGWQAGIELANAEFNDRLARLKRDYTGMLQYRRLVAQGMMDRMVLADADFGVTGTDGEMRIGSRTVRVVNDAAFQTDPTRWRVRSITARDALIVESGEIPALSADLF
jgi:defect in organelle trafficking protein DotC